MSPLSRNTKDATIQFRDSRRWGRWRASVRGHPLVVTSTGLRLLPLRCFNREYIADHFGLLPTSRQADSTRAHRESPEPSLVILISLDLLSPLCLTAGARPA